ncbi:MAG: 3' terminal RNA ribose 2'-O-methyltransferase Hen1 [Acidimicrobiales bacterium]
MLLTISTTAAPLGDELVAATDLGHVLHKHPDNLRSVSTTGGQAMVFWPEAGADRATVATMVDVDPIGLVRRGGAQPLAAYVNDRPYVASSFLSVAIGRLFRSAMNGDCPSRPELVDCRWPVVVRLPAVPIGGDRRIVDRLFGPLGYRTEIEVPLLDPRYPEWGSAEVAAVTLEAEVTMRDLLRHLYVLLPVLDNDKHYWIDEAEVEKLLRHGDGWLGDHPEHELITRRYLGNYRSLTRLALAGLAGHPDPSDPSRPNHGPVDGSLDEDRQAVERQADADEATIEKPLSLNDQRLTAVVEAITATEPSSVVDLGCGEGNLLRELADDGRLNRLVGVDVATSALQRAERRLKLDRRPERQKPAIELRHSSLTYRDPALADFDVACLVEVVEHLDPPRLEAVEPILFRHANPKTVIVTTPNREYNALFNIPAGTLRHRDHRFEWTRAEFEAWCGRVGETYHYRYALQPIGPVDPDHGAPTQMAVLTRNDGADG